MGRLPYEKQYELAYQIYEALCARQPDWSVALYNKSPARGAGRSGVDGAPNEATASQVQRGACSLYRVDKLPQQQWTYAPGHRGWGRRVCRTAVASCRGLVPGITNPCRQRCE